MPSPNARRVYYAGGYYHLYNRGVEKRPIFYDRQDYQTFLFYLDAYLSSPEQLAMRYPRLRPNLIEHNMHTRIKLLSYCLMPNHIHLLVFQSGARDYSQLMKQLTNAHTQYFNQKYARVGSLFQGPFKARFIENESSLVNVANYIHQNPVRAGLATQPGTYVWSSWQEYHGTQFLCSTDMLQPSAMSVDMYQPHPLNPVNQRGVPLLIPHALV